MKRIDKKAFTLVELLVVIAILAVLATVAIIGYSSFIEESQVSNDNTVVTELNRFTEAYIAGGGEVNTVTDIAEELKKDGFLLSTLKPSANKDMYAFNINTKKFMVITENDENLPTTAQEKAYIFVFVGSAKTLSFAQPESGDHYSMYLQTSYADQLPATLNVKAGVDVGEVTIVTSINYNRSYDTNADDGIESVIRTNSASTTLTIDDASTGTIYHYGSVGALNIIRCHTASYHEKGNVAFAEIAKGRIVLESGSEIKHIHVNAKEDDSGNSLNEFDTIIIADNGAKVLPEAITRDQVDVSEAKPVVTVESGSSSETVYVYPYTDSESTKTGTTEQTTTQNTAIATDLGKLVLDNGSDAGEKAMSNNEKTSAKQEVVEVAQNEEEIEKAENAGYEVTHYDEVAATCTEDGHSAYDSYYVNNEEHKVGYKLYTATGHNLTYTCYTASGNLYGHQSTCTNCGEQSAIVFCTDDDHDIYCDYCNQAVGEWIEVTSTSDLYTDRGFGISNGYYKLMNDVALTKPQYSNVYLNSNVVIDLNGYTLSNYPLNSPADAQFRSYGTADSTFVFTLKDSSDAKTGQFMSRFGDHFLYGGQNNGNNKLIIICEDGVTINTSYDYQGNEMDSFSYSGGYFVHNVSKDIEIRNAHLIIGGIADVNSGYTVTFKNCTIESRQSSGSLQSGSGNIVFDGCTITTVMQSSSGNVLNSSDPNVTFINGTTVNGVTK